MFKRQIERQIWLSVFFFGLALCNQINELINGFKVCPAERTESFDRDLTYVRNEYLDQMSASSTGMGEWDGLPSYFSD